MTIASCLTRMLSGAAVAAMFVVSPVVLKIDALGITVAQAVALAQVNPDPIDGPPDGPDGPGGPGCGDTCGPPDGPIDPPGGPIDPPVCDVDCGPPDGPIDPPPCEVDCGPPGGPIDPPPCEVDCGPPDGPIDTPENCETSKEGCEPAPVVFPSPGTSGSDDDDVVPPETSKYGTTQDDATKFAKGLSCQTPCTAVTNANGNVTLTLNSLGPDDEELVTTIVLRGTSVKVEVTANGKPATLYKFDGSGVGGFGYGYDTDRPVDSAILDFDNRVDAEAYVADLVSNTHAYYRYNEIEYERVMNEKIEAAWVSRSAWEAQNDKVNDE